MRFPLHCILIYHPHHSYVVVVVASQMWLLGRLLQLLIYQWIPEQNEQWLSYLLLLDIVDIILAPSIDMEDTALLCAMVQDHHYDFVTIYPGVSVIPKMHSMIHMARLIQR